MNHKYSGVIYNVHILMSMSTAQIVMFPLIYSNYSNYVHLLCVLFVYIQYNI